MHCDAGELIQSQTDFYLIRPSSRVGITTIGSTGNVGSIISCKDI